MIRYLGYMAMVLFTLTLAGCISPEEQRAMDQDKCSSFGFAPETDAFANCMMKQSERREDLEQRQWEADESAESNNRHRHHHKKDRYGGCHGIGCEVDMPDDDDD